MDVKGDRPWCRLWCAHVSQAKASLLQCLRKPEVATNWCYVAQGCEFEQSLGLLRVEAQWFRHHPGTWESGIQGFAPPQSHGVGWVGRLSHHPHHKTFLPLVQPKPTLFQSETTASCPVTAGSGQKSLSLFPISCLYILNSCSRVSLEPSVLHKPDSLSHGTLSQGTG